MKRGPCQNRGNASVSYVNLDVFGFYIERLRLRRQLLPEYDRPCPFQTRFSTSFAASSLRIRSGDAIALSASFSRGSTFRVGVLLTEYRSYLSGAFYFLRTPSGNLSIKSVSKRRPSAFGCHPSCFARFSNLCRCSFESKWTDAQTGVVPMPAESPKLIAVAAARHARNEWYVAE